MEGWTFIDYLLYAEPLTCAGASVAEVFVPLPTMTTLVLVLRHFPSGNQMSGGSALPWKCSPGT